VFIPLGTDRPLRRPTRVTPLLIGVNILVFIAILAVRRNADPADFERLWLALALDPHAARPWAFITYAFLHDHSGFLHIAGNMLFLWVFGPPVEDRLGRIGFLLFYLAAGAAAGGTHVLFDHARVVGASGAVAGVTGAFLVLFPRTHIKTFILFFYIGVLDIPAVWFIGFAIARDFLFSGAADGVARLAHLGGYAWGLGVAMLLLATHLLKREPMFDLLSVARHAKRRSEMRAAIAASEDQVRRKMAAPTDADGERLAAARAGIAAFIRSGNKTSRGDR